MLTPSERIYARTVVVSAPDPMACHCPPTPPLKTPGHSQASLAQSLVGSQLLSSGSWCIQDFVCVLKNLFPESCVSSVIRSHRSSKSNSLGFSVCLPDPQVGNYLVGPRAFTTVQELL